MRLLFELFFSSTVNANLSDISTYNYSNAVEETIKLIEKNEIRKMIKRCKSNNVSKSNDISNRILCQDPTFWQLFYQGTRLNPIRKELASILHKSLFCTIDFLLFFSKSIFLIINIS
jgi:hypothetical protein